MERALDVPVRRTSPGVRRGYRHFVPVLCAGFDEGGVGTDPSPVLGAGVLATSDIGHIEPAPLPLASRQGGVGQLMAWCWLGASFASGSGS